MSWTLHRIDDRLIHGQVLIAWAGRFSPARMWIADDAVAASAWERQLFLDAAPGVEVHVGSVAEVAAAHAAEAAAPGGAFLLVRDLATAQRLVEAGARIATFNVGGVHYAPGREKVHEYVYLDGSDREHARWLMANGVRLEVQDVPASRPLLLESLDPALRA